MAWSRLIFDMILIQIQRKASTEESKTLNNVQYIQPSKSEIINKPSGHLSPKAVSRERVENVWDEWSHFSKLKRSDCDPRFLFQITWRESHKGTPVTERVWVWFIMEGKLQIGLILEKYEKREQWKWQESKSHTL